MNFAPEEGMESSPNRNNIKGVRIGGNDKSTKSAYVAGKMEERERKLAEDTANALKFKKDQDEAAIREQADFQAAKEKHDKALTAWAEDHGKKRNVRTLLSTMERVVWEGCRWKPVSMADLIPPNKVKLAYRKAMLVVHPDKCVDLPGEDRFVAKRIFEAVNEAYAEFAAAEM